MSPATHSQAPSLVSIAERAVRHGELGLTRRVEWIGCHQRRRDLDRALQQNSALKLHMVGHTDNVGQLPANLDLSHRRADAVVKILSTKYSIAAARLDAGHRPARSSGFQRWRSRTSEEPPRRVGEAVNESILMVLPEL